MSKQLADRLDAINHHVGNIIRWATLFMMLIQFTIVMARYVFGYSSIAMNESVLYLHGALFMLGAGYTLLVDEHVRVDIFYAKLGERGKRVIDIFGHLFLLIPSIGVILYYSWGSVVNSWKILEGPLSVGGIPAVFIMKSYISAFCILLLIQSLSCIIKNLSGFNSSPKISKEAV